jgi:hypothetical protein
LSATAGVNAEVAAGPLVKPGSVLARRQVGGLSCSGLSDEARSNRGLAADGLYGYVNDVT